MGCLLNRLGVKDNVANTLNKLKIQVKDSSEDDFNSMHPPFALAYVSGVKEDSNSIYVIDHALTDAIKYNDLCPNYVMFHEVGHVLSKRSNNYTWEYFWSYDLTDEGFVDVPASEKMAFIRTNYAEECTADFIARSMLMRHGMQSNQMLDRRLRDFRQFLGADDYVKTFNDHLKILSKFKEIE